jgi:hypothetical protein
VVTGLEILQQCRSGGLPADQLPGDRVLADVVRGELAEYESVLSTVTRTAGQVADAESGLLA